MGCMGGEREKQVAKEHHWNYFNLSDFKSNSCWAPFSYGILYITLIISIACYILDILTCIQLIFSDRWQGQLKLSPLIPFEIARWIFTGCILLSFAFLVYRWWKAIRAIRTGSVVASYLDPLAVRLQSIRMGQGQGWRRFLVFSQLTKSKKGAEYVALFSYFSFEASLRILFAEGPRQVINGLTIYSIMRSEIIPVDGHAAPLGHSPFVQFFLNVKVLAEGNLLRAIVFFGMMFTLLIWILAALSLASACILYVMFLWHHIPSGDGGLRGYCKRKVDGKLQSIVDKKIKKALDREEKQRLKEEARAVKAGQPIQGIKKQPTLPVLATSADDKLQEMPSMTRQPTFATLPEYESRPGTSNASGPPRYGDNFSRPGLASRSATQTSNTSVASDAPLMGGAAAMGYSDPSHSYSQSQMSTGGSVVNSSSSLGRSLTGQSGTSQGSYGYGQRPPNQMRQVGQASRNASYGPDPQFTPGPPMRSNTNDSFGTGVQTRARPPLSSNASDYFGPDRQFTPAPSMRSNTPTGGAQFVPGPPSRQNTGGPGYFGAPDRSGAASAMSVGSGYGRRTPGPQGDRAFPDQAIEMQQRPQLSQPPSNQSYRPYSPAPSALGQAPRLPFTSGPARNFSSPVNATSNPIDRPGGPYLPGRSDTAPPQNQYSAPAQNQYDGRPGPPARSATAGPTYDEWPQHGL